MRALKRITNGASALVLAVSSLVPLAITGIAHATVQNCTWTGTSSLNFNTAGNWTNCNSTVPQTGDNMIFDVTSLSADKTLNNNITGLSVNNITFQGSNSSFYDFTINGNNITLTGNIIVGANNYSTIGAGVVLSGNPTITTNAADILTLNGIISGTGNIAKTGTGMLVLGGSNTFTGTVTLSAGTTSAGATTPFGQAANAVTVGDGADLSLQSCSGNITLANALTLTGASSTTNGSYPVPKLSTDGICSGAFSDEEYGGAVNNAVQATLSGAITFGSDVTFGSTVGTTTLTGPMNGNFKFNLMPKYYGGTLVVSSSANNSGLANNTYAAPIDTETLSDDQSAHSVQIDNNAIITIDGKRGQTNVDGTLKGTGIVNGLFVDATGIVAPGHSPGTLTVTTTLTLFKGATYQAELKDKTAGDFDQIVVGTAADTTGNDVTLGDGTPADGYPTLDVHLYDGYNIKAGDQFEIINNQSKTAVSGIFNGLPEGATFNGPNGSVFKISYVGGDGNDVVLTAVTAPKAPDTGFALMAAHPGATLGLTVLAAGTIFAIARTNRKPAPARARASKRR